MTSLVITLSTRVAVMIATMFLVIVRVSLTNDVKFYMLNTVQYDCVHKDKV